MFIFSWLTCLLERYVVQYGTGRGVWTLKGVLSSCRLHAWCLIVCKRFSLTSASRRKYNMLFYYIPRSDRIKRWPDKLRRDMKGSTVLAHRTVVSLPSFLIMNPRTSQQACRVAVGVSWVIPGLPNTPIATGRGFQRVVHNIHTDINKSIISLYGRYY